jgi:hypothetical protein
MAILIIKFMNKQRTNFRAAEYSITLYLAPSKSSFQYQVYPCVVRDQKIANLAPYQLRQLAGVAELRHSLGATEVAWKSDAQAKMSLEIPDALWHLPRQVIAIEYDAGSYNPTQLENKASTFAKHYSAQIWGFASDRRRDKKETFFNNLGRLCCMNREKLRR